MLHSTTLILTTATLLLATSSLILPSIFIFHQLHKSLTMRTMFEKKLVPNQRGSITLIAEEPDDLWIAYNIISKNDIISTQTERKVIFNSSSNGREGKSNTSSSTRLKLTLEIQVLSVEYQKNGSTLRAKGIISSSSSSLVKSGVYHTLEIELNQPFQLRGKIWSSKSLNALKESSNQSVEAELAVVLMGEGEGNLYLVNKGGGTKLCATIVGGNSLMARKNQQNKYFESLMGAFKKFVDFNVIKCGVIAGPGSIKDQFHHYLFSEAQKLQLRSITDNRSRVLCLVTCSTDKHSLREVLELPKVINFIRDAKIGEEGKLYKVLTETLDSNSGRACYGLKDVEAAVKLMAVEKILINDDLFKSSNVKTRGKYEDLVHLVKESGGIACVFSSAYSSGEELRKLTGVAAILRFPLPDLDLDS